jgi:hypothetical protein
MQAGDVPVNWSANRCQPGHDIDPETSSPAGGVGEGPREPGDTAEHSDCQVSERQSDARGGETGQRRTEQWAPAWNMMLGHRARRGRQLTASPTVMSARDAAS